MKILLVDDNAFMLQIQSKIVEKTGVQIVTANNGLTAIEIIKKDSIDFVLMDMQMPDLSGPETTKKIRTFNTQLPIIALTGNDSNEDKQTCLNAGMNGVLNKPLNLELLKTALSGQKVI